MTTEKWQDLLEAYNAGYNAGEMGSNTDNTHFSFFATPELCKEWERGKNDALYPKPKLRTRRMAAIIKIAPNGDESFHE